MLMPYAFIGFCVIINVDLEQLYQRIQWLSKITDTFWESTFDNKKRRSINVISIDMAEMG